MKTNCISDYQYILMLNFLDMTNIFGLYRKISLSLGGMHWCALEYNEITSTTFHYGSGKKKSRGKEKEAKKSNATKL